MGRGVAQGVSPRTTRILVPAASLCGTTAKGQAMGTPGFTPSTVARPAIGE